MSQTGINNQEPQAVVQVVEHLFRHEAGKLVAPMTWIFGLEHLALAEDVVQEALACALQTWPFFYGVPDNPAAWIMRTARGMPARERDRGAAHGSHRIIELQV